MNGRIQGCYSDSNLRPQSESNDDVFYRNPPPVIKGPTLYDSSKSVDSEGSSGAVVVEVPDENASEDSSDDGEENMFFHDNQCYPIFLPIDRDYESKYTFHYRSVQRKSKKSLKERAYLFLEHPMGWGCFLYHFSV